MATDLALENNWTESLVVSSPASPLSGQAVRVGNETGVAITDMGKGGNYATKTTVMKGPSNWRLPVSAVNDAGNSAVAVGDALFFNDGDAFLSKKSSAGYYFGQAREIVPTGATATIIVAHIPSPSLSVVTAGSLTPGLVGSVDGNGLYRVAKATFNPTAVAGHRSIAAHGLGVTIPDNAIVLGGFVDAIITPTSATDAATIAISLQTAADIHAAVAISTGVTWDAPALLAIIPKSNTPESTGIKLTAAREITVTVAVEALLTGQFTVFLTYVQGD
jgi:hypothetical protein